MASVRFTSSGLRGFSAPKLHAAVDKCLLEFNKRAAFIRAQPAKAEGASPVVAFR
jgi:hypothetical protein